MSPGREANHIQAIALENMLGTVYDRIRELERFIELTEIPNEEMLGLGAIINRTEAGFDLLLAESCGAEVDF